MTNIPRVLNEIHMEDRGKGIGNRQRRGGKEKELSACLLFLSLPFPFSLPFVFLLSLFFSFRILFFFSLFSVIFFVFSPSPPLFLSLCCFPLGGLIFVMKNFLFIVLGFSSLLEGDGHPFPYHFHYSSLSSVFHK
jgi:hypothetical protein